MENIDKTIKELLSRVEVLEAKLELLLKQENKDVSNQNKSIRDKTKYMFNGNIYPKSKLVLAIIKEYVKINKTTSYSNLSLAFPKSLQGSLGVFKPLLEAKKISDGFKRFYMEEVINLQDESVVVCTQWGAFNINRFIVRAKELGFNITMI